MFARKYPPIGPPVARALDQGIQYDAPAGGAAILPFS